MVFNVLVPVVALVDADSAEQAVGKLQSALEKTGFTVFEDGKNAFLSEEGVKAEVLPGEPR